MSVEIKKIANNTARLVSAIGLSMGLAGGNDAKAVNPQEEAIRLWQEDRYGLVIDNPRSNYIHTSLNIIGDPVLQEQQPEPEPTPSITLTPVGSSNIRRMPSTQSEILGATDASQRISSLGYVDAQDGYRWYYFRFNDNGAWIRADRVNNPGETVENIPDLRGVVDIPVLNPDGSSSDIRLLETNVNLALVSLAFKNIREAGFPEGTTNPSNIALLAQRENSLVFTQLNTIGRPDGGINETGSIFTIDIDEGKLITRIGFFGPGQIKDIAASYEIDLGEDMFSVEEMPDGFVRIGDNMIFYWRGAAEKLIEGLSQEDAISQSLIQIAEGELSGRSFTIEGDLLVFSDGSRVDIDFSGGIGRVQVPEMEQTSSQDGPFIGSVYIAYDLETHQPPPSVEEFVDIHRQVLGEEQISHMNQVLNLYPGDGLSTVFSFARELGIERINWDPDFLALRGERSVGTDESEVYYFFPGMGVKGKVDSNIFDNPNVSEEVKETVRRLIIEGDLENGWLRYGGELQGSDGSRISIFTTKVFEHDGKNCYMEVSEDSREWYQDDIDEMFKIIYDMGVNFTAGDHLIIIANSEEVYRAVGSLSSGDWSRRAANLGYQAVVPYGVGVGGWFAIRKQVYGNTNIVTVSADLYIGPGYPPICQDDEIGFSFLMLGISGLKIDAESYPVMRSIEIASTPPLYHFLVYLVKKQMNNDSNLFFTIETEVEGSN